MTATNDLERYKKVAQELADLTRPKCMECRTAKATRCCAAEHCVVTAMFMVDYAQHPAFRDEIAPLMAHYREVDRSDVNVIPFMGEKGCIVPPHLRPNCTAHQCDMNSIGFFKGDPVGTKAWFQLYDEMNEAFGNVVMEDA